MFYINTSDLPSRTLTRVTALYLHEAMPGHHLQGSLAQEDTSLAPTLRFGWNAGYGEGWALYAEWLGYEMGLYSDPVQRFGQLDMEIFRAARLVVDTGLHAKGWSRQRAVDYMVANTSLERSYCELEVDRYIVWPGQACAYKLGDLKIRALRHKAEPAWARVLTSATSTRKCWAPVHCRCLCLKTRSITGSRETSSSSTNTRPQKGSSP